MSSVSPGSCSATIACGWPSSPRPATVSDSTEPCASAPEPMTGDEIDDTGPGAEPEPAPEGAGLDPRPAAGVSDAEPGEPDEPAEDAPEAAEDEPEAAPPPAAPAPLPAPADRPVELRLAALHLRTGVLALARAELETSAGRGELDDAALLDLAEVRWRTDDVTGAGEAAAAYFATGREDTLALVIATEATASLGRSTEARRLATRALARGDVALDSIFLGIRPSSYWPAVGAMTGEPAGTLFGGPPPGSTVGTAGVTGAAVIGRLVAGADAVQAARSSSRDEPLRAGPPAGPGASPGGGDDRRATPTLWTDAETMPPIGGQAGARASGRQPEPADELDAARDDLRQGRVASGAIRLAVVLRLAPVMAPAVLDALAGQHGPSIELVRGDALRLVGHERDARLAYAAAAAQLDAPSNEAGLDPG